MALSYYYAGQFEWGSWGVAVLVQPGEDPGERARARRGVGLKVAVISPAARMLPAQNFNSTPSRAARMIRGEPKRAARWRQASTLSSTARSVHSGS